MSLGKVNAELQVLMDAVVSHTGAGLAITRDERFASIPERCVQINKVAEQLALLLRDVAHDASDYATALKPFHCASGERSVEIVNLARAATAGSLNEPVANLPSTVWNIGGAGIHRIIGPRTSAVIDTLFDHAASIDNIAKSTEKLADNLQQGTEQAIEDFNTGNTQVITIIDNYTR
jgi:hypothetical protein